MASLWFHYPPYLGSRRYDQPQGLNIRFSKIILQYTTDPTEIFVIKEAYSYGDLMVWFVCLLVHLFVFLMCVQISCLFDISVFCLVSLNFSNFPGSYHFYIFVDKLSVLFVITPEKEVSLILFMCEIGQNISSIPDWEDWRRGMEMRETNWERENLLLIWCM